MSCCRRCYFAHHSYYALKLDPQALDNPDQVRTWGNTRSACRGIAQTQMGTILI